MTAYCDCYGCDFWPVLIILFRASFEVFSSATNVDFFFFLALVGDTLD